LAGSLYDIKDWLTLAFEVERAAAISEMGVVGDVIVSAVVATWGFAARFCIHKMLARVSCLT